MPAGAADRAASGQVRQHQPGKRHISQRPEEANTRASFWHWEGDTVMGADQRHCILTLVERRSGYVLIRKLRQRTKEQACAATLK